MDIRIDLYVFVYVENSNSLWSVKLVASACNEMNRGIAQIEREMSNRLNSIRMKYRSIFFAGIPHCIHVQDISNFIVCVHQGHQAFFFISRKQSLQVCHINMTIW